MSQAMIKVFIVEDSLFMQKILVDLLRKNPQIEIVGKAALGKEALILIPQCAPDIVTLDVNLPDMSGLEVLKHLMHHYPVKTIMLSAYTRQGADVTVKALEIGALDFIAKPSVEPFIATKDFQDEVLAKIKVVADMDLARIKKFFKKILIPEEILAVKKIVVIGASTGGPRVIIEILRNIPFDVDASFLIVQHMSKGFTESFAKRISWYSPIKVKEASNYDSLLKKVGYVAPAGLHMEIKKRQITQPNDHDSTYYISLSDSPPVNYLKPSIDVTMLSVAEVFDGLIVGVILSGMGQDGKAGAQKIKNLGGKIIVQDKKTCAVSSMPEAVIDANLADEILPPEKITQKIIQFLS